MWIGLLIGYAAAIGYVSHQPLAVGEAPFPHFDKLLHLAEFALFFLLAWQATGRRLGLAWLLTLAFAGSDEVHQAFVPARDASVLDLVADMVGATLMAGVIRLWPQLWRFLSTRILQR
ncbi:VanZ family protein [Candidatus Bipolaricaulota bacterium]|nr:VanZ family protein [Candidatus Bipolaricaulota bacterium]